MVNIFESDYNIHTRIPELNELNFNPIANKGIQTVIPISRIPPIVNKTTIGFGVKNIKTTKLFSIFITICSIKKAYKKRKEEKKLKISPFILGDFSLPFQFFFYFK